MNTHRLSLLLVTEGLPHVVLIFIGLMSVDYVFCAMEFLVLLGSENVGLMMLWIQRGLDSEYSRRWLLGLFFVCVCDLYWHKVSKFRSYV